MSEGKISYSSICDFTCRSLTLTHAEQKWNGNREEKPWLLLRIVNPKGSDANCERVGFLCSDRPLCGTRRQN